MKRCAGSSSRTSLPFALLALLLACGCGVDHDRLYAPRPGRVVVFPPSGSFDHGPAVAEGGRTVAWVRVTPEPESPRLNQILRWDLSAEPETLVSISRDIAEIDLSAGGDRVAGHVVGDTARLLLWTRGEDPEVRLLDVPRAYMSFAAPRWTAGATAILFGATGPDGAGVYRWDLAKNAIAPVATRFADIGGTWLGSSPGLDRRETLVCMERAPEQYFVDTIIAAAGGGDLLYEIAGQSPAFWQIAPGEEDGILYIDGSRYLHARRLATGEEFRILPSVYDFDVSADGRWLFADASMDLGRYLTLLDLRDLR